MRDLLIATGNEGKVRELKVMLSGTPFNVLTPNEVGIAEEPEESASTLEGNALIKAFYYGQKSGLLTIADDSGLEIDALGGRPGVRTKEFAATTNDKGHAAILAEMTDVADQDRGAQFQSVIAIYDPKTMKVRTCNGTVRGSITREAIGTNGFGQDPIFRYDETGKTGGEMSLEEKNKVSHRAKAFAKAKDILLKDFV